MSDLPFHDPRTLTKKKPLPSCKKCNGRGQCCGTCDRPASACICSPSSRCSPFPCPCLKRRSQKGKKKGNKYENQFCKQLSLWWSSGMQDYHFEPARGSGGKSRRAAEAGKAVYATGDVLAVTKKGAELYSKFKIELKRGYNDDIRFPADLFRTDGGMLWDFVNQAQRASLDALGSSERYWLVLRQDRCPAYIMMEESTARVLHQHPLEPPGFLIARNHLHGTHRVYLLDEFFASRSILERVTWGFQ